MDEKVDKFCPNCSQLYNILPASKVRGNLPLFLPCGHSMCEKCIKNILKCMEPIECKVCQTDVDLATVTTAEILQDDTKFYKTFPVNVHMVGELFMDLRKDTRSKNVEEEHFIDLKALLRSESSQGHCSECHAITFKMCKQCATIVCDSCFNKSHKNFVVFKSHVLQNIEANSPRLTCKIHAEKLLDYYCKDCKKAICIDCMMIGGEKSCKTHDVVSLQEINESFMEDLKGVYPKVDETFRRLTKTAVDIGYLLGNYDNDTGTAKELVNIITNIDQHFSKLCAVIQKHKDEVTNIVMYLKHSEKDSLYKAKSDVANAIKKCNNILKLINNANDPNKMKEINLPGLLEDAKKIVDTPWYLNKSETNKESLKVSVNEDLCTLVSDYIHLEGNVKSLFKLSSTSELGEDVEIPPPPTTPVYPPELPKDVRKSKTHKPKDNKEKEDYKEQNKGPALFKNAPKYRSKSGSVSSLNSVGSESSYKSYITQNDNYVHYYQPAVQPVSPFPENQHPQQLREGSQELIYISHIVDPHNFFVQRACHQGLVKDMLREFRNAVSFVKPSINHVMQGKTYLAFNEADNMWQRCRVISINKSNSEKPIIRVFCFDFGSIENVTIDRLRLLPPAKIQSPYPLALNCSLANCVPKTGVWTSDDAFLIQNIIDNKQAVIHVRGIISTSNVDFKLDCDITTFDHGVSLAHALVFHDRAKMPNPKLPYPTIVGVMKDKPKLFMSHNDFKPDTPESVYITHIVSPDDFYVRKQHLQEVYEKLSEDLQQEYSLPSNSSNVYLPEVGMVCAVNVEKYSAGAEGAAGGWARAVVRELPGRGRARVALPDLGAALLVHWTALRHIHNKFTTLRALAVQCHLAGITPFNKQWSTGSVSLLQKYDGVVLELQIEDLKNRYCQRNRGSIGVTLYDKSDPNNIVCINNEMINYKFAVSIGVHMFNKYTVEEQVFTNKSPLAEPPKPKRDPNKITVLKKQMSPRVNEDDLQAKDKGPLRLEVKVLHYQSPSLFYVSLLHQQKTFDELFENIQKYYTNPKNKAQYKNDWKVGDRCCTICIQSQTWRRAVILELDNDKAKVFYSDFACIETVPVDSLRELPSDLMLGDAAIKCHLSGIIPAVGEEWPSITKEYLKELLDVYKRIFITKVGVFKDKSMPVQIWVYHTVQGGALEPNTSEWRCLNDKIIEQGLGIPEKCEQVSAINDNEESGDDKLSFLNITGSVNDWLQLEPVPMVPLLNTAKQTSDEKSPDHLEECESDNTCPEDKPGPSNVIYISDWLPTEPLQNKEFTGLPTYIDDDGVIYLHDVAQQDTLDLIRKAMDVRYKDPDIKAKFTKWTVGEPCVARFFLDNRYYRGRIVEVNKETATCVVHYIDYGNVETCAFTDLRKSVPLHQIPIQAHKCMLNRIRPVGHAWDRQTLDYIHKSIVEKKCYVKIVGELKNGILPIELKYDKLWINDHLVDFEMAEYVDGSKSVVKKFAAAKQKAEEIVPVESDSGPDYIVVDEEDESVDESSTSKDSLDFMLLKDADWNKLMEDEEKSGDHFLTYSKHSEEEFKCTISIINNINILELNIILDEESSKVYEQLFQEVQAESADQPPLNGIYENKACVALFPEDDQWYRASILQFSETMNKIKVKYVDYGNIDVISLADCREIRAEWTELPPATISAKLYNVDLNPDVDINIVTKEYANTFLDQAPFTAKVVSQGDSIPLVELKNDDGDLVYQKLIEEKTLIITE